MQLVVEWLIPAIAVALPVLQRPPHKGKTTPFSCADVLQYIYIYNVLIYEGYTQFNKCEQYVKNIFEIA
jgi:hypothetical protein